MKVNKKAVIDMVAKECGFTKKDVSQVIDTFLDAIESIIKAGDEVQLTNFGKFYTTERASRININPRTGEKLSTPAKTVPKFRASSVLKAAVA